MACELVIIMDCDVQAGAPLDLESHALRHFCVNEVMGGARI
jgi:hypothetical protein